MIQGYIGILVAAFGIGLSGALMPGPLFSVVLAHSAKKGFRHGYQAAVGHAILELAVVVSFFFGLQHWLTRGDVMATTALAGSAVLAWMGYGMIREAPRASLATDGGRGSAAGMVGSPLVDGALASISNPYWLVWWATVGTGQASVSLAGGAAGLVVFYVGHICSDLLWYGLVSTAVSKGRKLLDGRRYRIIVSGCGGFLLVMALFFLWSGVRFFLK